LKTVFGCVLAAFRKMAAKVLRVIGFIFFRVSSRGSRFSCFRFIDVLYHAQRRRENWKSGAVALFDRPRGKSRATSPLKMVFVMTSGVGEHITHC
jgi:hypothetical protein